MPPPLIDTQRKRHALNPRKEPYWHRIRIGIYVGLYVGPQGRFWRARAATGDGRYAFTTLGDEVALTFDEASEAAQAFARDTAHSGNVAYTVEEAVKDYVADRLARNGESSAKDAEQRLALHAAPALGRIKVRELTSLQIKRWHDGLVRQSDDEEDVLRSKDGANHLLSMLKAALNLAYRLGLVPSDAAWRRVRGFKSVGAARTLFLTPEEVSRLLQTAQGGFRSLLQASVLTGARYKELYGARVRDFSAPNRILHVTGGKTGAREVHLSAEAAAFFRGITKDRLPDAWLLVRDDGSCWCKSDQHRPMREAVAAARLPREATLYSLRHYYISRALLAGVPPLMLAHNCGTSIRMIEKHYGKFMQEDRQRYLDQVRL
jgi:integrase